MSMINEKIREMTMAVLQTQPTEVVRKYKLAEIAKERWRAEEAGTFIGDMPVYTDRHSQAVITSLVVQTMSNPDYTVKFKTPGGFMTLDKTLILSIADAVRQHVEAQFLKEKELIEQVNAAKTREEILAITW